MFPLDFEHDGEFQLAPMPHFTWYETHIVEERRSASSSPSEPLFIPEIWHQPPYTFDVARAKRHLVLHPRLPAFVDTSFFDDDVVTSNYLKTIYRNREDEWPWVHVHVPGIIGYCDERAFLIDGNHRYAKAKRLKHSYFFAYLLTPAETASLRIRYPG